MLQRHVVLHTQIIGDGICQVNVRMSDLSKVQKCFWLNPNSLISCNFIMSWSCSPGEKMSGLKRMSKDVLLIEPTALQAFRTTSRLLGSDCDRSTKEYKKQNKTGNIKLHMNRRMVF